MGDADCRVSRVGFNRFAGLLGSRRLGNLVLRSALGRFFEQRDIAPVVAQSGTVGGRCGNPLHGCGQCRAAARLAPREPFAGETECFVGVARVAAQFNERIVYGWLRSDGIHRDHDRFEIALCGSSPHRVGGGRQPAFRVAGGKLGASP